MCVRVLWAVQTEQLWFLRLIVPHFWGGHWQAHDTYYCDKKIVNRVLPDVGPLRAKTQEQAETARTD